MYLLHIFYSTFTCFKKNWTILAGKKKKNNKQTHTQQFKVGVRGMSGWDEGGVFYHNPNGDPVDEGSGNANPAVAQAKFLKFIRTFVEGNAFIYRYVPPCLVHCSCGIISWLTCVVLIVISCDKGTTSSNITWTSTWTTFVHLMRFLQMTLLPIPLNLLLGYIPLLIPFPFLPC